jgi:hypothetical protein
MPPNPVPTQSELEREARRRADQLDSLGKLPAGFVARHYPLTSTERVQLAHQRTAWRLAPDLHTLEQLLAGAPVDADQLDQDELLEARRRNRVILRAAIDELPNVVEAR